MGKRNPSVHLGKPNKSLILSRRSSTNIEADDLALSTILKRSTPYNSKMTKIICVADQNK